MANNCKPTTIF